jgi:hypothetical protein
LCEEEGAQASSTIANGTKSVVSTNKLNFFLIFCLQVVKSSTGEEFDLIKIPADPTKPNKFVLNAIDKIFKNENELLDIDPRGMETDDRITTIRGNPLQNHHAIIPSLNYRCCSS